MYRHGSVHSCGHGRVDAGGDRSPIRAGDEPRAPSPLSARQECCAVAPNAAFVASAEHDRPWMGPRAERLEQRLQVPMLVAALLVIPDLVLEEAHVGATGKAIATFLNWATWLAFVVELVAMLAVVRDRRGYLRHNPLGLVVTFLTPPFVPAVFQS